MYKHIILIQHGGSNNSPARYLQLVPVHSKVRYIYWTPLWNKLWLEWLNMDEMDLGTRSYSVYVTNSDVVIGFCVFWWYFDHFWYKFYVVKGSDTCHNTYFRDEYNLSPVQGSYMVYSIAAEREDMVMRVILKSRWTNNHSGNPFCKHFFKMWNEN